jgi:hypothetical protein
MIVTNYAQFAIVNNQGEPLYRNHQDDHETPVVADSIEGLANELSDMDLPFSQLLDEGYKIVKQQVTEIPLTAEDGATIKSIFMSDDPEDEEDDAEDLDEEDDDCDDEDLDEEDEDDDCEDDEE